MTKEYELRTLKDVFDKLPADRIPVCLIEIAHVMSTAKALIETSGQEGQVHFPDVTVWKDDGKGETGFVLAVEGTDEKVATVKLTPDVEIELHRVEEVE